MKICGCNNCRIAGEINLYDEFEKYLTEKEYESDLEFELIFLKSYTIEEMDELYSEYEESFNVAERIQAYLKED
jgi:hypothetical protein